MKLTRLSTGLSTAVMAGVLATAGACDSEDVEGEETLEHLTIAPLNQTIQEGGTLQLNATAIYSTQRSENVTFDASWSSDDESVVERDGDGRFKATGPGEAVITASYEGLSASTTVFVEAAVEEIQVSPAVLTLAEGTSGAIDATGIASDGSKRSMNSAVDWASSNQDVLTIDASGNVEAVDAGTSIVTASQGGQVIGEVEVTVTDANLDDITIAIGLEEMLVGTDQPISITALFADDHEQRLPLEWEVTSQSLDDDEAEGPVVDFDSGFLVALQSGTATFEGSYDDTTSNEVTVTVLAADLTPESITVNAPGSVAIQGQPLVLSAMGDFGGAGEHPLGSLVSWQGSDDTVLRLRGPQATPRSAGSVEVAAVWPVDDGDPIVGEATIDVVDTAASGIEITADSPRLRADASFGSSTTQDVTSAAVWSSDDSCAFVDNAPARSGEVTILEENCTATITVTYKGQSDSIDVADIPDPEDEA